MKKLISIILCLGLIFSAGTSVFADESMEQEKQGVELEAEAQADTLIDEFYGEEELTGEEVIPDAEPMQLDASEKAFEESEVEAESTDEFEAGEEVQASSADELSVESAGDTEEIIEEENILLDGDNVIESGTAGPNIEWTLSGIEPDLTLTFTGSGEMYDFSETSIPWASKRSKITKVVVGDGISSVGNYTCYSLNNLTQADLGPFITSIGSYAFADCVNLSTVVISDQVIGIGDYAFKGCRNLTNIMISEEESQVLTDQTATLYVDANALGFGYLLAAEDYIYLNESADSFVDRVLRNNGFTPVFQPGAGYLVAIGRSGIASGTVVIPTELDRPEWTDDIDYEAGSRNPDYLGDAANSTYGSGFAPDAGWMFAQNGWISDVGLSEIALQDGDEIHYSYALFPFSLEYVQILFALDGSSLMAANSHEEIANNNESEGIDNLASVTLPKRLRSLGKGTFQGCSSITSIMLPETMTKVGSNVFSGCSCLTDFHIPSVKSWLDFRGCVGRELGISSIHLFIDGIELTSVEIPEDTINLEDYVFYGCDHIVSVTIPEGVVSIGDYAFSKCPSLISAAIPDSVITIGESAFYGCSSLETVRIPDGVTRIEESTFGGCDSLFYVMVPDSVISIGIEAFFRNTDRNYPIYFAGTKEQWDDMRCTDAFNSDNTTVYYSMTDPVPISAIQVTEPTEPVIYGSGNTVKASLTIAPENATHKKIYWESDNTSVINIDVNGELVPVKSGTATITASTCDGSNLSTSFTVSVEKGTQNIIVDSTSIKLATGKTQSIKLSTQPADGGKITYSSADSSIADVNSKGVVTAKSVGTAKITVTAAATDNYKKATKTVTVKVVPAATTSLKAENLKTGIKLTWKKVAGAAGYYIYRDGTKIKNIKSGSTLTYNDTKATGNGTKYTYKIRAYASTGTSTLSKSVIAYGLKQPTISSLTNSGEKKMTVKWSKNTKGSGYQIQYSRYNTFSSKKTVTLTSKNYGSKAITGLTKGKTYYVRVRTYKTVSGKKYYSAWSPTKSVKIAK